MDRYNIKATFFMVGDNVLVQEVLKANADKIVDCYTENDRRNSAVPMLDITEVEARIEPGCTIRDRVAIGKNAVIMMGAVINIGASIGEGTMIDMNAVLGARATVGKNAHVGAGAVLAGVLEPPSATPVIVEDGVLIGANAVVLEGVKISKDAVVAAMLVTEMAADYKQKGMTLYDGLLALYEKYGFQIVGERPNAFKLKDGRLLKEYFMQKELKRKSKNADLNNRRFDLGYMFVHISVYMGTKSPPLWGGWQPKGLTGEVR